MSPYAEGTSVTPEASQAEIGRLLRKYGAQGFQYGWEDDGPARRAAVAFKAHGRLIRFIVILPDSKAPAFWRTETGRARDAAGAARAYDAEVRRRWRCLALAIKAKLEAVETGIATFEDEFLAYTVLPGGTTVGQEVQAQITAAYESGVAPRLQIGGST